MQTVSLAQSLPSLLAHEVSVDQVLREGETPDAATLNEPVDGLCDRCVRTASVTPQYFATMAIRVVIGRDFTERDDSKALGVAIVNQAAARQLFGSDEGALGKRVRIGGNQKSPWKEVVGIVEDRQDREVFDAPQPLLFEPFLQTGNGARMMLVVRAGTPSDLTTIAQNVRREVQALDPRVPISELRTGSDHVSAILWFPRLTAGIAVTLAVLALLLAALGLYSVMAFVVNQHTREIGIRVALGARSTDVQSLVLIQGIRLTVVGVVAGLAGSWMLTRVAANALRALRAADPLTFILIAALLTVVALLACYVPARRATRVDPIVVLRYE